MKNKKIFFLLLGILIFSTINCNAERAYSVGTKYATGLAGAGDDFTGLVDTAADAYGWLSGYTSYYSKEPTYTYLKGSRLGTSQIFFIAGHGAFDRISVAAKNTAEYRTGISMYSDGSYNFDEKGNKFVYAGMSERDMSKTKLITFAGCNTGVGMHSMSNNLVKAAVMNGATAAVGFDSPISNAPNDTNWLKQYNYVIGNGYPIKQAISSASAKYPGNCSVSVVFDGDISISLGVMAKSLLEPETQFQLMPMVLQEKITIRPIEEEFITRNIDRELSYSFKENEEIDDLIEEIKKIDKDFSISDYKVDSHLIGDSFGHVFFTYYIDGYIKTNKIYMVEIDDFKVKRIIKSGVTKENLSKLDSVDNSKIVLTAQKYEKSKNVTMTKNGAMLTRDNKNSAEEKYFYYDYNKGKLSFIHNTYDNTSSTGMAVNTIEEEVK